MRHTYTSRAQLIEDGAKLMAEAVSLPNAHDGVTTLSMWWRNCPNRPYVSAVEYEGAQFGKEYFKAKTAGSVERAYEIFDASGLYSELTANMPEPGDERFPTAEELRAKAAREAAAKRAYQGPAQMAPAVAWLFQMPADSTPEELAARLEQDLGLQPAQTLPALNAPIVDFSGWEGGFFALINCVHRRAFEDIVAARKEGLSRG